MTSRQPSKWPTSSVLPPLGALATACGHVRGTLAVWRLNDLSVVELVVSELAANGVNASAGPEGGRPTWRVHRSAGRP